MKDKKQKEMTAPNEIKSTLSSVKSDSLVIDFESLLVPGAILLAGLMVSLSIIFSFRGASLTNLSADKGSDTTNTDTGTTDTGTKPDQNDGTVGEVALDGDPYQGDLNKAKVAIVEFSDYECPFCKRHFQEVYPDLYDKYIKTGKAVYVFRDLPLSFHEPAATREANAAQCVQSYGDNAKYFKFHDAIFTNTAGNGAGLTNAKLISLAKSAGVSGSKFESCVTSLSFSEEIKKDAADAAKLNIQGTPGFIIGKLEGDKKSVKNGTFLGGAYPLANFETLIDAALK